MPRRPESGVRDDDIELGFSENFLELVRAALDRSEIAEIVFHRTEELEWLEAQLHPLVREKVKSWREGLDDSIPLAIVEIPLLHESGMGPMFDAVVCVIADDAERQTRAQARGLGSLEGRSDRQLTQEEKAAASTHVVRNDGTLAELSSALEELAPKLRALRR